MKTLVRWTLGALLQLSFLNAAMAGFDGNQNGALAHIKLTDDKSVQTFSQLGLPHGNFPDALELTNENFEREISNGNKCLEKMKADLESLKSNPELKDICEKFSAANEAISGKTMACLLTLTAWAPLFSGYKAEVQMSAIYPSTHDRPFEVYGWETLLKQKLDKNSWATALEAGNCQIDQDKIAKAGRAALVPLELMAKQKADGARKTEVKSCQTDYKAAKTAIDKELSRIKSYIPQAWLNETEKSAVANAKAIPASAPDGEMCFDRLASLSDMQKRLQAIQSREKAAPDAVERESDQGPADPETKATSVE